MAIQIKRKHILDQAIDSSKVDSSIALSADLAAEQAARIAADSAEQAARIAQDLTLVKLDGSREMTGDLHMGHAAVVAPPSSGGTLVGMQQLVPPSQIANIMISGMGENGQFYIIGSSSDWQSRYLALSSNEGQSYTVLDAGNWDSADGFIEDVKINAAGVIFVKKAINNGMDRVLLYSLDNGQTFLPVGLPSDFVNGGFEFAVSGPDLIVTYGIYNPDLGTWNHKIQRTSDYGATYNFINSTENVPDLQTTTIQVSSNTFIAVKWADGAKLLVSTNGGSSFQTLDLGAANSFTLEDSNHVIVSRPPNGDWTQPYTFDRVNLTTLVATPLDGFNAVVADLKQAGKMLGIVKFSGTKFLASAMGMMMDNTLYHGADIDTVSVIAGDGSGSSAGQSTPAVYHSIKYLANGVDAHDAVNKSQLDAAIASEVSSREAGDANLQSQINNILSNVDPAALDSLSEVVAAFQAADNDLNNAISALGTGSQSGLAQEISDRQAADAVLQSAIDALSSSSENLDGYAQDIRSDLDEAIAALEAADAALDARLDTLEAAPVLSFDKEQFTAASPLTDIVLAKEVIEKSLVVHVGRLALHAGQDYSISVVAGKTKLTWIGDFAVGGVEGIEVGDQIYVTYHYWA